MKVIKKSHVILKATLATVIALSCVSYGSTVTATENPTTDTLQNETSYAKVTSITQNEDNTVTITLDKKIKKSNMSGLDPGKRWTYDGELSLTSNVIPETGEFFADVILLDVDGVTTHHNLYRDENGEWKVVVEYRYNDEFLYINPQLFIQIGNELIEIEDYKQYGYLGKNYVVEETFTATPKIVVKGYDLEDIETYLQRHSDTKNIYEPTGDHTTTVGYLENEGKTVSGVYTVVIDHKVNGSVFMPKIEIKYKEADRTALDEKITEAKAISSNGYTEESFAALQSEIEKASAVSTSNISTQSEIDNAVESLKKAIDGLQTDTTAPEAIDIEQVYEPKQNGRIKATVTFNEPVKPTGGSWTAVDADGDGYATQFYSYYYRSKTVNLDVFEDRAGNKCTGSFEVDRTAPELVAFTQVYEEGKDRIKATLTFSEEVKYDVNNTWRVVNDTDGDGYATEYIGYFYRTKEVSLENFADKVGNPCEDNITIDKTVPTFYFENTSGSPVAERTVRLVANEAIQSPGEGWSVVEGSDGKVWEKTFTKNYKENNFTVKDIVGNISKPQTLDVKNVDSSIPTGKVEYSTTAPTNGNVTVTLTTSTDCTTPAGWTKVNWRTFTKVYEANGKEDIYLVSRTGIDATEAVTVEINNIDKTVPAYTPEKWSIDVEVNATGEKYLTAEQIEAILEEQKQYVSDNYSNNITVVEDEWYNQNASTLDVRKVGVYPSAFSFYIIDEAGNRINPRLTINVVDTTAPVYTPEKWSIDIEVNAGQGYLTAEQIEAILEEQKQYISDNSGSFTVTEDTWYNQNAAVLNVGEVGIYPSAFSFYITDESGNRINPRLTINVVDTTAPVYTPEKWSLNIEVDVNAGQKYLTAEQIEAILEEQKQYISDNSGKFTVTEDWWYNQNVSTLDVTKVGVYPSAFSFYIVDGMGNRINPRLTVNVVDTTAPVYTPDKWSIDIEVNQDQEYLTAEQIEAILEEQKQYISDNSGSFKVTEDTWYNQNASTLDVSKIGVYPSAFSFYITDESGNHINPRLTVNVIDTTAPVIELETPWFSTHEKGDVFTDNANPVVTDNSGEALEAVMDRVTYAETKEGLETSQEYSKEINVNQLGWYKLRYVAVDSSGNRGYATRIVQVVDTTAPTVEVTYSTTELTNGDVLVTVSANEVVTISGKGWIAANAEGTAYEKVFTENDEEVITVTDISGNAIQITVDVKNIDKTAPTVTITYEPVELTNGDVLVTVSADEVVTLTGKGWVAANAEGTAYEKTFTENDEEVITVTDLAGNSVEVTVKVANIDKVLPSTEVTYSTEELTNGDVVVTVSADEVVTLTGKGWVAANAEGTAYEKTFTENDEEVITVTDLAGNSVEVTVKVANIDKVLPSTEVTYSTEELTNGDVVVTVSADEVVTLTGKGWVAANAEGTAYEKAFTENDEEVITVTDLAGNSVEVTVKVENIDKVAPTVEVTYSTTETTNDKVTVTLTADEKVTVEQEGWVAVNAEGTVYEKVFAANGEESVVLTDLAGNTTTVDVKVNNITTPVADNQEDTPEDTETPKTGDMSLVSCYGMIMLLSAMILIVLKKKASLTK